MMSFDVLMDFVGSLAVLGMLVLAYGTLRQRLPEHGSVNVVKGSLFGLVSVLQMYYAFSPAEGIIIDLRCVPVVLAGAFLGLRACLVCVFIAAATRLQLGGIGATTGVAAIMLSGATGLLWRGLFGHRRGITAMLWLAAIANSHLGVIVLLPYDHAIWFLRNAAPVIVAANFLALPTIGLLMERERLRIRDETRLRADAIAGLGDRFMPRQALEWALTQAATSGTLRGEVVVVGLHLHRRNRMLQLWGPEAKDIAMRAMRDRLDGIAPKGSLAGAVHDELVLLALPGLPEQSVDALLARVRREITEMPVKVAGTAALRLSIDATVRRYPQLPAFAKVVEDLAIRKPLLPVPARTPADAAPAEDSRRGPGTLAGPDMLFETFDRLHALRFGSV